MNKEQKMYDLHVGMQDSILRAVAKPVKTITPQVRLFAHLLIERMWAYDGVGLAAPQIGESIRMFAYTQRDTTKKQRELLEEGVMINPVLAYASSETLVDKEGCLSLPGVEGEVERAKEITMVYTDLRGKQCVKKAKGYNARILLHELDHLDGVLFPDKAVRVWEKKR